MTADPGTDTGPAARPGGWQPANDVERRLGDAATAEDLEEMLRILAGAPLLLPGFHDADPSLDGPRQSLLTRERDGVPYVLAFTSPEGLHRTVTADGWRATTLSELARAIPAGWGLAINPVTPAVVLVAPDALPTLVPTAASLADFIPANEVERRLAEALVAPAPEAALDLLVTAPVIVPTQALEVDGVLTVPVFTSSERHDQFLGDRDFALPTVTLDLVAALQRWPGSDYRLVINPGSPISLSLPGERVPELLRYAKSLARRLFGDRTPPPGHGAGGAASMSKPSAADDDPPNSLPKGTNVRNLLRGSG